MIKPLRSLLLRLLISSAIWQLALGIALPVKAQIAPDGTTNTTVTPIDNGIRIDEGNRAGDNLFHSFREFSVPNSSEAFFNNANDIVNIFSRVTGGDISSIDGLIRANGEANLFLINPAGIIFGENASFNIGGSFFSSTAESVIFSDNQEFSATDTDNLPLLTINQPIGLNFANNPGEIAVNGSNLQVNNGETLALVGGNLTVTKGQMVTSGGRIELGSVGENSFVSLAATNPGWLLGYQDVDNFQNLRLLDSTNIAVNGNGKGSIAINANNIELHSGSNLEAGIDADFQLLDTQAQDITLNASDRVSIDNGTIINEVQEQAIGNGGKIKITGRSLFFDNGAKLSADSLGEGNTGSIILNAHDTFSYDGAGDSSATAISASQRGTGNGSQITINASEVSLLNGATIVSHNIGGRGNAGSIEINVTDNILIDGVDSGVGSQVFAGGIGNGGTITVDAPRVSVLNGAAIVAHTNAQGNAGDIRINANEVFLDGVGSNGASSGIGSAAFELATGGGGTIAIDTDSLNITKLMLLLNLD